MVYSYIQDDFQEIPPDRLRWTILKKTILPGSIFLTMELRAMFDLILMLSHKYNELNDFSKIPIISSTVVW